MFFIATCRGKRKITGKEAQVLGLPGNHSIKNNVTGKQGRRDPTRELPGQLGAWVNDEVSTLGFHGRWRNLRKTEAEEKKMYVTKWTEQRWELLSLE